MQAIFRMTIGFGVCRNAAKAVENGLAFAELPQVSRRCSWRLRSSRKSHGDSDGVCRNAANAAENGMLFPHRCCVTKRDRKTQTAPE